MDGIQQSKSEIKSNSARYRGDFNNLLKKLVVEIKRVVKIMAVLKAIFHFWQVIPLAVAIGAIIWGVSGFTPLKRLNAVWRLVWRVTFIVSSRFELETNICR